MTIMVLEAAAAANLLLVGSCATAYRFRDRLLFNLGPMLLGSFLGSLALARFMGWPL